MPTHTRVLAIGLRGRREDVPDGAPVPLTIATTAAVERHGFREVLDCSASGVDLSRAPLSLIVAHDTSQLAIGVVENLQATGDRVIGEARFGSSPEAQQVRADVLAKIHRYVSVGYRHLDDGRETPDGTVFRWLPYEVSIVAAPADVNAGFFRSQQGNTTMPAGNHADAPDSAQDLSRSARRAATRQLNADSTRMELERQRVADILALSRRHNVDELGAIAVRDGISEEDFRGRVLNELARRDFAAGGHLNVRTQAPHTGTEQILETLVARLGGRPQGEILRNASCADLAVRCLDAMGVAVNTRDSRDSIIARALHTRGYQTTSDFPSLLGDAVGRVLAERYAERPPALRAVARLNNLRDFRDRQVVRMGVAPSLERVNEHGEFKHGSVDEGSNAWRLTTYGRIIAITRQALVNDDLGGFEAVIGSFAEAAARREADELVSLLLSNPTVDGAQVFSVGNQSQISDVLGITGLGAAVAKLRAQQEFGELVMQEPGALVVPAALEMTARQLVASIVANQVSAVQPWKLEVVVEPRLDATSTTAWYLAASNQRAFEYGYLDGAQGLQTFTEEGFDVDGMRVKARLDFGCGWVAPVGWVKSTGAGA